MLKKITELLMQALRSTNNLTFKTYRSVEISEIIDALADLRMTVFREYPYLYDGNLTEEQKYLAHYVKAKDSFVLVIFENGNVIGATTAVPLIEAYDDIRTPFENAGMNLKDVFYFGEAMLLPAYRGMGLYKIFMREREHVAKQYGAKLCSLMAVKRPDDHPLKPKDYQDLKPIWNHYGFVEHPEIEPWYSWKDIDQPEKTKKPFSVWVKNI